MIHDRSQLLARASLLALLLCMPGPAARAESMTEAIIAALNQHPSVEAAIANRDALREEGREEWSGYFPNLNMRATGGRGYSDNSTSRGLTVSRGAAYSWIWESGFTLTQPLFDGFETMNRVDAAYARRESATYNIEDVREGLALRTVVAYLDIIRGREQLDHLRGHKAKIEDYLGRIKKMVDEGAADQSMLVQAKDIMAQLENTLADVEGQAQGAAANYVEVVGHAPDEALDRPDTNFEAMPGDAAQAWDQARRNHPMLQAAILTEKAQEHDADAEKQFYYPDVNGELSYQIRDQIEEIGGESLDKRALIRANWDLSVAGGQIAKLRKTQYRYAESRAKRAETERRVERDIRLAYSDLDTANRQLAILQDRLKLNEELFKNYQAQFEGARINLLQLLQAENALFNAKLSLMNGEYRQKAARYAVLASSGILQTTLNIVPAKGDGG